LLLKMRLGSPQMSGIRVTPVPGTDYQVPVRGDAYLGAA
jgi:hypothetical protein